MDFSSKVSDRSGKLGYFAVRQHIDLGMPTDIQQLWRENSYGAVIGRKGLVQLRHLTADAGILFNKMNLDSHVAQVQCGLHTGYSTADNQNFL